MLNKVGAEKKRILLRSKSTPLDTFNPAYFWYTDICNTNSGNMLYQHAVYKHLSTHNVITCSNIFPIVDKKHIDTINEEYDHIVIPFANAFRPNFKSYLEYFSNLFKKIKIPITITGVGTQTSIDSDFSNLACIKDEVKEFVSIALDRSHSIGVRGEITKQYLESLGFKNNIDIVGCPSMFTNHFKFTDNLKSLNKIEKVALSMTTESSQCAFSQGLDIYKDIFEDIFNHYNCTFIAQETKVLNLDHHKDAGFEFNLVNSMTMDLFCHNKSIFFMNSRSWIHFLKDFDISIGTRLHGCIASLLAGVPSILFVHDSRTYEIAEYFKIPYILLNEKHTKAWDINRISSFIDLSELKVNYNICVENYKNFLNKNKLQHNLDSSYDNDIFENKLPENTLNNFMYLNKDYLSLLRWKINRYFVRNFGVKRY